MELVLLSGLANRLQEIDEEGLWVGPIREMFKERIGSHLGMPRSSTETYS